MVNISVLIGSCEKYSDLWDAHISLYREHWEGTPCKTFLVTDKTTERRYDGVEIIVADSDMDFPMRIKYALDSIDTPYVLLTLDDYFLTSNVRSKQIEYLAERAQRDSIDYLLLYNRRKTDPRKYSDLEVLEHIDLSKKYALTLYPAIWSTEFLRKTVFENLSPWLYEVSLTQTAVKNMAKCCFSPAGTFDILDVIRKGKVLHKANRYFKKHGIDIGDRPIVSRWVEIRLAVIDWVSWYTPRALFKMVKTFASRAGMRFYSDD